MAKLLKAFIGERKAGFVFQNQKGRPLSQTNILKRSLYPVLESLGVDKAGFHAMRRTRVTWLREKFAPEDLIRFWIGHSNITVTDGYSKLKENVKFRKEWAKKVGLGFSIPTGKAAVVPNVPKKLEQVLLENAA